MKRGTPRAFGQHPRLVAIQRNPQALLDLYCPRAKTYVATTGERVVELDGKLYRGETMLDVCYCAGIHLPLDMTTEGNEGYYLTLNMRRN